MAQVSIFKNRDYLLLWSGQTVSAIGSQFSGFVIPLLVLMLTNSPAQAVGALQGVPYIVFSLPAGALVDRWNRKLVMIVCDTGRALNMLSVPIVFGFGHLSVWQLYVVALIEGTLFVFFNIAETSSLATLVLPEQLPAALGQQETTWGISSLIGPATAGVLYTAVSAALPFLVDAFSYVVSALSLTAIRGNLRTERTALAENLLTSMREALSWLWNQPLVRVL
jgi:MFS family permease